jgi:hypothetical protein
MQQDGLNVLAGEANLNLGLEDHLKFRQGASSSRVKVDGVDLEGTHARNFIVCF